MHNRPPMRFTLTADHIRLLRAASVCWEDCEAGAPAIDCKRPYGNSYVAGDVAELLNWATPDDDLTDAQRTRALALHDETEVALQIVLTTGAFEPGDYRRTDQYRRNSWVRVSPDTRADTSRKGEG